MVRIRANRALHNPEEYGTILKGQVVDVTEAQLVRMRELEKAGIIERVHRRTGGQAVAKTIRDFKALVGYENKSVAPARGGK